MELFMELGSESAELLKETEENINERTLHEYQSRLVEAVQAGNTEQEKYYNAKIEQMQEKNYARSEPEAAIGECITDNDFARLQQSLKRQAGVLQSAKREYNALTAKRKSGVKDPELEQQIAKAKAKVEAEQRNYEAAQQYVRNEMRSCIPFGGALGVTETKHSSQSLNHAERETEPGIGKTSFVPVENEETDNSKQISFGASYSTEELEKKRADAAREADYHAKEYVRMVKAHLGLAREYAQVSIEDHLRKSKKYQDDVKSLTREINRRK